MWQPVSRTHSSQTPLRKRTRTSLVVPAGTIVAAERHRGQQPTAGDIQLGDESVAEVMQTDLYQLLVTDAAFAEAWRVAHELRRDLSPAAVPERRAAWRPASWRPASWMAAAALVLLTISVVVVSRRDQSGDAALRDSGVYAVESLVPSTVDGPLAPSAMSPLPYTTGALFRRATRAAPHRDSLNSC